MLAMASAGDGITVGVCCWHYSGSMDPGVARLAGDGAWEDVRALVREAQGDLSADCAEALLARADPVTAAILLWLDGLRVSDEVVARLLADAAPGTRDVLRIEAERRARAREGSAAHAAHLARSGRVDALVAAALECEALISMNLGDGCRGIARVAAEAGREDGLGALVRHAGAPVVFGINDDTLPSQLHSLRERRRALVREGPRLFGRACARSDAIDLAAGRTQEPAGLLPRRSRPRGGVDARACRMDHLPLGAARCVLSFLPARALTCLSCCGRRWRNATQSPSVWARLVWVRAPGRSGTVPQLTPSLLYPLPAATGCAGRCSRLEYLRRGWPLLPARVARRVLATASALGARAPLSRHVLRRGGRSTVVRYCQGAGHGA